MLFSVQAARQVPRHHRSQEYTSMALQSTSQEAAAASVEGGLTTAQPPPVVGLLFYLPYCNDLTSCAQPIVAAIQAGVTSSSAGRLKVCIQRKTRVAASENMVRYSHCVSSYSRLLFSHIRGELVCTNTSCRYRHTSSKPIGTLCLLRDY